MKLLYIIEYFFVVRNKVKKIVKSKKDITNPESADGLTLAQRFKLLRSINHMNQKKFADFIGISQSQISAIEINARNPSRKLLQLIASKCNCSAIWLEKGTTITNLIQSEDDSMKREEKEKIISLFDKMNIESLLYLRRQAELIYNMQLEKEDKTNFAEILKK